MHGSGGRCGGAGRCIQKRKIISVSSVANTIADVYYCAYTYVIYVVILKTFTYVSIYMYSMGRDQGPPVMIHAPEAHFTTDLLVIRYESSSDRQPSLSKKEEANKGVLS